MLIAALALTAAINIEIDLNALLARGQRPTAPEVTCGITTVGYRFVGRPGQEFRYAGDTYRMPKEGAIELIADRRNTTYRINDRSLPLDVWPLDQFGFREVPLPIADAQMEKEEGR